MPGIDKVLQKVSKTVESGAFYEAQQMYKTIYHRYKARKQLEDSYQILKGGAIQQLHSKQVTCGVELGLLLVEAYVTDSIQATPERLQALLDIIAAFPEPSSEETTDLEECSRFIAAAIKWAGKSSSDAAARATAVSALHNKFGLYIFHAYGWKHLGRASVHLARGDDSEGFATVLHGACSSSGSQEEDLFITRAVLQILASASSASSSKQLQHAQQLLGSYQQQWGLPDAPLVNFAKLLLQALEKRSSALFKMLKHTYAAALEQDATFSSFLDKAAATYLGTGAGQQQFGGLFGSLLKSFAELDEEDDL